MSDAGLCARAEGLLGAALAQVIDWPESSGLRRTIMGSRDRLGRPMRVALAGLVKAGKSTLVNALLGQRLVATGAEETTFNVNWLSHGDAPTLEIDFKDGAGRLPETRRFRTVLELAAELDMLTRRGSGDAALLRSIRHVRARYPHTLLKVFELIDTPGLESVYGTDAANTRDFLRMRDQERTAVTRAESSAADAVLYLFKGNLGAADLFSVDELKDPALARSTPLNTLGVLTMADTFWPAADDPLATAAQVIRNRHSNLPQLARTFYTILPVAGECALGAATLTDAETATLRALADASSEQVRYFLRDHKRFCGREEPGLPDLEARKAVWDRLGRWGVWKARELIGHGIADRATLTDRLEEASGVRELRRMLVSHFGLRSQVLQVHRACQEVIHACGLERTNRNVKHKQLADRLAADFERLYLEEPAFDSLRLLGRLYEGQLVLTSEERLDLLAMTGERGASDADRLGSADGVSRDELREIATRKRRYWHIRAGDLLGEPAYKDAARVLSAAYGRLLERLNAPDR
jgi:GTPase SAR1 family protein